jgi:hypothetical protein
LGRLTWFDDLREVRMARQGEGELREVLRAIADDSKTLRQLREDPDQLAKRFDLDDRVRKALKDVDVIIAMRPRAVTFETGSTFTA